MKRLSLIIAVAASLTGHSALAAGPNVPQETSELADLLRAASEKSVPAAAALPAEEAAPKTTLEPYGPIVSMVAWAVGLGAILLVGAFFARRMKDRGIFESTAKELRVDESLWVGRGQRILLLSVGERRILVGVTSAGFEGIAVMESPPAEMPAMPRPKLEAVGPTTPGPKFSDVVKEELVSSFKPSQNDRRRIIERLNTL